VNPKLRIFRKVVIPKSLSLVLREVLLEKVRETLPRSLPHLGHLLQAHPRVISDALATLLNLLRRRRFLHRFDKSFSHSIII
jgi:hypothetical protein